MFKLFQRPVMMTLAVLVSAAMMGEANQAFTQETTTTGVSKGGFSVIAGGGSPFERTVPAGGRVTAIAYNYGVGIDWLTVHYETAAGEAGTLPTVGGTGGDHPGVISLTSKEILAGIKVRSGVRVDSIIFMIKNTVTKTVREVRIGGNGGDQYTEIIPDRETVGIFGNADRACLCTIGLIYKK